VHGPENAHVVRIQSNRRVLNFAKPLQQSTIPSLEMQMTEVPFGLGVCLLQPVIRECGVITRVIVRLRIVGRQNQAANRRISKGPSIRLPAIQNQQGGWNDGAWYRCGYQAGYALNGVATGSVVISIERELAGGQPGAVALGERTGVADRINTIVAAVCGYRPDPTTQSPPHVQSVSVPRLRVGRKRRLRVARVSNRGIPTPGTDPPGVANVAASL